MPPLLRIAEGEKNLRRDDLLRGKTIGIGFGKAHLPRRGGSLTFLQPQHAGLQLEQAAAKRNRAGRNQHHFDATAAQLGHIFAQGFEPATPERAALLIHQQRRPDLDDDAVKRRKRIGHGAHSFGAVSTSRSRLRRVVISWASARKTVSIPAPETPDMV